MTDNVTKLPKWAQAYIKTLERQREVAIKALNDYLDTQTVSPFYIDELEPTGEQHGPSIKRQYIQTHKIAVEFKGVVLEVFLRPDERGIEIGWSDLNRQMNHVAFIPVSFNRAQIVAKENMR